MKSLYIYLVLLLGTCVTACNESDLSTGEIEGIDELVFNSMEKELPNAVIDEKIKDVQLDVTAGVHGALAVNPTDTVQIDMEGLLAPTTPSKRLFSYYIPQNLTTNYRIMFEFHGNFDVNNYYVNSCLTVQQDWQNVANQNNMIIIQPIGSILTNTYGWYVHNGDLRFIDALIALFKKELKRTKQFDLNEKAVFATGTSSGGIFSWGLTYYRNNKITAAAPRFGSVRINPSMVYKGMKNKTPMMIVTGKLDTNVAPYSAVLSNAEIWASKMLQIRGAAAVDSIVDFDWGISGKDKVPVKTKVWTQKYSNSDGALLETFLIEKASHSDIYGPSVLPVITKFLIDNTSK